jgi:hypothetical protein
MRAPLILLALAVCACQDRGAHAPPAATTAAAPTSTPPPAAKTPPSVPAAASEGPAIRFSDVTAAAGIDFRQMTGASERKHYLEPHGGGLPDLFAVDGGRLPGYKGKAKPSNRLYRNKGDGSFEDITAPSGLKGSGYGFGAYPADFDGDGDDDLFVTTYGADLLYRNDGARHFSEVGRAAGVAAGGWSTGAAWFDADGDGDLDLFVAHYVVYDTAGSRACWRHGLRYHCSPYDFQAEQDHLYLNRGDGTFTDATARSGIGAVAAGKGLGALAYDFDLDGRTDLYVANDETPNLLHRNLGGGRFEEVGLQSGVAVNEAGAVQAGMGVDAGDIDGDGLPDLIVTNFQGERNNDYRQLAKFLFADRGLHTGFGPPGQRRLGFGALLFDADLDGDLDAFVANGHVWDNVRQMEPDVGHGQANLVLENRGGRFHDASAGAGEALLREDVSRGACLLDLEGDGDLDVFYVNLDDRAVLLRNDTARVDRHWLEVRLVGEGGNRRGIGARVELSAGGVVQQRQVRRGRGYLSSSDQVAHFGLGPSEGAERLSVRWPGGPVTELGPVDGDRSMVVRLTPGLGEQQP